MGRHRCIPLSDGGRHKYLFVAARNDDIREQLVKAYCDFSPAGNLDVFCVANQDYQGRYGQGEEAHKLAIQGSGIPELRRFCHSIPARAQFRATNHFLEVQLKGLVQSLELWLSAGGRNNSLQLPLINFSEQLFDVGMCHSVKDALADLIRIFKIALSALRLN